MSTCLAKILPFSCSETFQKNFMVACGVMGALIACDSAYNIFKNDPGLGANSESRLISKRFEAYLIFSPFAAFLGFVIGFVTSPAVPITFPVYLLHKGLEWYHGEKH